MKLDGAFNAGIHGSHSLWLVLVSIALAVMGAWTSMDLLLRGSVNAGRGARYWTAGAAVALATSIWSMHFVAMLAYRLPGMTVDYDVALTVASWAIAVLSTWAAFAWVAGSGKQAGLFRLLAAGFMMGLGICSMHLVGMSAMLLPADLVVRPDLLSLAVVVAVVASSGALLAIRMGSRLVGQGLAAAALGAAVSGMHYTAMAAVSFVPTHEMAGHAARPVFAPGVLAINIAAATFFVLFLALVAALFDRRFAELAEREASTLRRNEERVRDILDHLPMGVLVADAETGHVVFSNPEAERMLGHPMHETAQRRATGEYAVLQADGTPLAPDRYPLVRAGRNGERIDRERVLYRRGAGGMAHLEISAAPLQDRNGRVSLAIVAFQDITSRVKADEVLRRAQRIEVIGQLTGGIVHDFNNLLQVISGGLSLLGKAETPERRARIEASMAQAAAKGGALTRRLLAVAGRQTLRPEPIDLAAWVDEGTRDLVAKSLRGDIGLKVDIPPGIWPVHADRAELELAVLNLAVNARDAMPSGGHLAISAENVVLAAGDEVDGLEGEFVRIRFKDTGTGMPPEVLSRIFEPFFTTKDSKKGSGLGLPQVYGFARQSGGTLRVTSEVGRGTVFTLKLPRARTLPVPKLQAGHTKDVRDPLDNQLAPQHLRVLVVEDEEAVAALAAALFERLGHTVVLASDGASGLRELEKPGSDFDLIFTDVMMPGGVDGLALAEAALVRKPGIPILLTSGYAEAPARVAASGLPLLSKPFELEELRKALLAVMGAKRAVSASAQVPGTAPALLAS